MTLLLGVTMCAACKPFLASVCLTSGLRLSYTISIYGNVALPVPVAVQAAAEHGLHGHRSA